MIPVLSRLSLCLLLSVVAVCGQALPSSQPTGSAPAAAPAQSSAPAASSSKSSSNNSGFLGEEVPLFDGGTDVLSWNGKRWNVNNQRVFRGRFEKYLNAKEQTSEQDIAYQKLLAEIQSLISPQNYRQKNLDLAWGLLPQASNFDIDARLCDSLANAIYSTWLTKNEVDRLGKANESLAEQRNTWEWNLGMASDEKKSSIGRPRDPAAAQLWMQEQQRTKELQLKPYTERLVEVNAMIAANKIKKEASELQAKIEFQTLLAQFFIQRRFQHVLIGTQFYRHLFGDGDTQLRLGEEVQKTLMQTSGMPPTLSVLDSLSNEAMRDVREGIDAYTYLLEQKELNSATERLMETVVLGEYMPEVRSLPRDKKRQALSYTQKGNQLISAIDVKDYALAEKLVKEMQEVARDFDASKPLAAIETARAVSRMHLAKAKNAATSGDRVTLETELKAAMEIWPRNPDLAQISTVIFNQADVQQQALTDLDRLITQKNYRQIFEDRVRFIAAAALYPEKQSQLRTILEDMQNVEGAIIRATEVAKRGDHAGAWEAAEKAVLTYPDDPKLNQLLATLTTDAADFVRSLRTAQDLEKKTQVGSSLAWYLKSQKIYPPSELAQAGIERLVKLILPES